MTEASWGSDQYVGRFDYGGDYPDAMCVRSHEQQFTAENYGISGYRCGGKPPAWHNPPSAGYECRAPADGCKRPRDHVRGPPGNMAGGPEGTRSGGWFRETPALPVERLEAAPSKDCVQITIPKQWLFIIMFVFMLTMASSVGMCYKLMRKLSKYSKQMKHRDMGAA